MSKLLGVHGFDHLALTPSTKFDQHRISFTEQFTLVAGRYQNGTYNAFDRAFKITNVGFDTTWYEYDCEGNVPSVTIVFDFMATFFQNTSADTFESQFVQASVGIGQLAPAKKRNIIGEVKRNGSILFYREDAFSLGSGQTSASTSVASAPAGTILPNVQYTVELTFNIVGYLIEMKLNGSTVSITMDTTAGHDMTYGGSLPYVQYCGIVFDQSTSTQGFTFDNLYVTTNPSLGPVFIETVYPLQDVTSEWAGSGSHFALVNEHVINSPHTYPDDDDTYINATVTDKLELFNMSRIYPTGTIYALQLNLTTKCVSGTGLVRACYKDEFGTLVEGSSISIDSAAGYRTLRQVWEGPFTFEALQLWKFGVKNKTVSSNEIRVTQIALEVVMQPGGFSNAGARYRWFGHY